MIKNHHGVWVFDPYLALVGETSINNLDCQVFVVARVNGNMLSLFSQSMLGSGQSCRMFIPRGDWNQPAANMCQFPHQCFVCCSLNDAPPTFVTSNKPTPARSHPKVPFSDGLSFQLKQKLNKVVGSFSRWECTVFIDTIQYEYRKNPHIHPMIRDILPYPILQCFQIQRVQVQVAEQKVKNVLLGATTFFVGFNALAAAHPRETGGKTWKTHFFWYGFYVSCLNPSEYICKHLFKIYIYIYIQISRVRGFGGFRFGDFGSRLTCDLGFHRVFWCM